MNQTANPETKNRTFVMERYFNAPRDLVFEMFSKAEHLEKWYGPKDWTLPVSKLDFREGGSWFYCMRSPKGNEKWIRADYHEIIPSEKIVYTDAMVDSKGNVPENGFQMLITLTFEDLGDKTKVTNQAVFATAQEYEMSVKGGMGQGYDQAYDRLELLLETQ